MPSLPSHDTHVLVVGPGAIGAFVAARLARAGLPVTVACRTSDTADRIEAAGVVSIDEEGVETVAQVRAVTAPEELTEPIDIAFVATKCVDALAAFRDWSDVVPETAPMVSLQNGLMGDALAPLAPDRYVDTVVHFPASLEGPGVSRRTGPGGFHVGAWQAEGGASAPLERVAFTANVLSLAADAEVTENILGAKWSKLIINSCMTTLGAVTGTTFGELLQDRRARDAFLHISDEGYRAGTAAGVAFETIQRFHPARFAVVDAGAIRRAALHGLLRVLARKYTRHRSSSLQSLERGAQTEVDYLNGVIVDTAERHGTSAPVNRALVELVHRIERGETEPALARIGEIAPEVFA